MQYIKAHSYGKKVKPASQSLPSLLVSFTPRIYTAQTAYLEIKPRCIRLGKALNNATPESIGVLTSDSSSNFMRLTGAISQDVKSAALAYVRNASRRVTSSRITT